MVTLKTLLTQLKMKTRIQILLLNLDLLKMTIQCKLFIGTNAYTHTYTHSLLDVVVHNFEDAKQYN